MEMKELKNNSSRGIILEWKTWWKSLGTAKRILPVLTVITYWGALSTVRGLRSDLFISSLAPLLLYYAGPRLRAIYEFILPLCLVSVLYDSQRYFADAIRGTIHIREPYEFDKRFFGIPTSKGVLTPNEWWQLHTHRLLDFVTGIAYIIFIPVFLATAGYFRFWVARKGTVNCHAESIRVRSPQMMWAFLWVNLFGWSTYYWYAAAPPWYVALYGLGPVHEGVAANVAGCARFDHLVGFPVFANWYGHSADVFGAIPSLHVAYPFIAVYYAFRFGAARVATLGFYLLMCFSAVYLNHHYILDVIWGTLYAVTTAVAIDLIVNWRLKRAGMIVPGPKAAQPYAM